MVGGKTPTQSNYDRTPMRGRAAVSRLSLSEAEDADDGELARAFARLDMEDSGFVGKEQVLTYLNSLRMGGFSSSCCVGSPR
jgi:hypothetical protein